MKIVLCCQIGMSSSLLVEKMKKEALDRNLKIDIEVCSLGEADDVRADIILLAPQVHHAYNKLKKESKAKVGKIDIRNYGLINGKGVLDLALSL